MRIKYSLPFLMTVFVSLLISCKKNNGPATPDYSDSTRFTQSVVIKIVATKPSPSDSANTPLADSVFVNEVVKKGQDATGINLTIGARNLPSNYSYPGLEFSYYYNGVYPFGTPLVLIGAFAFPSITQGFVLNKTYSNTSVTSYGLVPVYLSMRGATSGPGKYFTGAIPPDATDTAYSDTTYCQVTFSKRFIAINYPDSIKYVSGTISGYQSVRYGKTDPTKYTQRWDFSINFTNLAYNIN